MSMSTRTMKLMLLALGIVGLAWASRSSDPQDAPAPEPRLQWEYKVFPEGELLAPGKEFRESLLQRLNALGKEGWELSLVHDGNWVMKRAAGGSSSRGPAVGTLPLWYREFEQFRATNPGSYVIGNSRTIHGEEEARKMALQDALSKAKGGVRLEEWGFLFLDKEGNRVSTWRSDWGQVAILYKAE